MMDFREYDNCATRPYRPVSDRNIGRKADGVIAARQRPIRAGVPWEVVFLSNEAALVRNKNHQVWRLPNGRNYVMSQTPSDWRAGKKQQQALRRAMKERIV